MISLRVIAMTFSSWMWPLKAASRSTSRWSAMDFKTNPLSNRFVYGVAVVSNCCQAFQWCVKNRQYLL